MKTTGKLLGAVYDLSANKLMGLAVKVKERPEWCAKNIPDFPQVRAALEKVLDIRDADRGTPGRCGCGVHPPHLQPPHPHLQGPGQLEQAGV